MGRAVAGPPAAPGPTVQGSVRVFSNGRRLRALGLHARAAALLLLLPPLLRVISVQRMVGLLTPRSAVPPRHWQEAEQARAAVDGLYGRRPFRTYAYGPCLRRSLTLYALLRHMGHPVRLAIGTALRDGALRAHAWLTLDGRPIFEPEGVQQRYVQMVEWGGPDA